MVSCVYDGWVEHRRRTPVEHRFRRRIHMSYLDLEEIEELSRRGLLSTRRMGAATFRRTDHLGSAEKPLGEAVSDLVEERTGARPRGPIRLLTHLRSFGWYFSPINLYYCFDSEGRRPEAVVAEVTNTPWLERHEYVLWEGNREVDGGEFRGRYREAKAFHVSPFMDMNVEYRWRLNVPGERLRVGIGNDGEGGRFFEATLTMRRRPLEGGWRPGRWARQPWPTASVVCGIYVEALKLWMKGCPYRPHPRDEAAKVRGGGEDGA